MIDLLMSEKHWFTYFGSLFSTLLIVKLTINELNPWNIHCFHKFPKTFSFSVYLNNVDLIYCVPEFSKIIFFNYHDLMFQESEIGTEKETEQSEYESATEDNEVSS